MAGISSSSLANNHLPLQSPEIIPRPPPNRQIDLGSEDFSGFRCIVPGVAEMGKVLAPSVNPFSCAIPVSNDPIRKNDRTIEFDAKPCEGTIKEELKEAINKKTLLPQSGKFHRKRRKPTATLHKACETQGSESTDGVASIGLGASSSCRYDSSLSLLTKKFLNLLLEASDGTLDLNKAAKELDETSPNGTEPSESSSEANVGFQELLNGEESRRTQRMRLSGKKMKWVRLEGEDGAMLAVGALSTAVGKFGDEVERARKEKYDERLAWRRRTCGIGGGSTE